MCFHLAILGSHHPSLVPFNRLSIERIDRLLYVECTQSSESVDRIYFFVAERDFEITHKTETLILWLFNGNLTFMKSLVFRIITFENFKPYVELEENISDIDDSV